VSLAIAALLVAGMLYAQNTPAAQGRGQAAGRGMMAQQQQMMADMKAEQKKLSELVASMNAATGADKVNRIAAVVTEMVAEHGRMSEHMMSMQNGMMQQMMQGRQQAPPEDHEQHHP
jgi:hypothetical protein